MLTRIRTAMEETDQGFTLIELLVVIIIIGILAAIAIPVFLNQRKKGVDASLKADLKSTAQALESRMAGGQHLVPTKPEFDGQANADYGAEGVPLTGSHPFIDESEIKASPGNVLHIRRHLPSGAYCLTASNPGGSQTTPLYYDSQAGGLQPTGTTACPVTV